MGCVRSGKESALVMIKPPGDLRRAGIFEINDGVFVPVKVGFIEQRPGAMQEPGKNEFAVVANPLSVKA
jgi:hypothetical protein